MSNISGATAKALAQGLSNKGAAAELVSKINAAVAGTTELAATFVAPITFTATTGSLPVADGTYTFPNANAVGSIAISATTGSLPGAATTQVIANTATPTVVELLALCVSLNAKLVLASAAIASLLEGDVEINAKVNAIRTAMIAAGDMAAS